MANLDSPFGFKPFAYRNGQPYRGGANRYFKDATAGIIGVGDPVIRVTNSSDPLGGPEIVRHTTGAAITGVVVRIDPAVGDLTQRHLASADVGYVYVADDPELMFLVQDNGGATGIVVANVGEHVDSITAVDADTTTGISKYEINTEAVASDNTWRIEALAPIAGNAVGANAKWLVTANLHTERNAGASSRTEV